MKKRWISLLLCLALAVSLPVLPASAAYGDDPDKFMTLPTHDLPREIASGLLDEPASPLPGRPVGGIPHAPAAPLPVLTAANRLAGTTFSLPEEASEISTAAELMAVTEGSYVLTADIDLRLVEWTSAPNRKGADLTIDGQGHSITGLSGPLLSQNAGKLTLKNLILTAELTQPETAADFGALAGRASALEMENCRMTVKLTATGACTGTVGGALGYVTKTVSLTDCGFDCTLRFGNVSHAGGVVGHAYGGAQLTGCAFRADMAPARSPTTLELHAGGVFGTVRKDLAVNGCALDVRMSIPDAEYECCAGGLAGYACEGACTLTDLRAGGTVSAEDPLPGPANTNVTLGLVVGSVDTKGADVSASNCGVSGTVTATAVNHKYAGGIAGKVTADAGTVTLREIFADVSVSALPADNRTGYAGGVVGLAETYAGKANEAFSVRAEGSAVGYYAGGVCGNAGVMAAASCVSAMKVTGGVAGGIFGAVKSMELRDCVSTAEISALLGGGIAGDTEGVTFTNCAFDGTLGLSSVSGSDSSGAYGPGATECCLGGIAAKMLNYTSMCRCRSRAFTVSAVSPAGETVTLNVGGLAGCIGATSHTSVPQLQPITGCCARDVRVTVSGGGDLRVGGLVGKGSREITGCWHRGVVLAEGGTATSAGGLVGYLNEGTVTDCFAEGDVTSRSPKPTAGGLMGYTEDTIYDNCYAEGTVRADGLAGARSETAEAGGFAAGKAGGEASLCRFTGNVYGSIAHGLGAIDKVNGCLVEGKLAADRYGAGVGYYTDYNGTPKGIIQGTRVEMDVAAWLLGAGFANAAETVSCSYAGAVSGREAYGLARELIGEISDCRVEGEIRGMAYAAGLAKSKTGKAVRSCSVEAEVSADFNPGDEEEFRQEIAAAGLIIKAEDGNWNSTFENCTFRGNVRAWCGADDAHETQRHTVTASGLYGGIWSYVTNCRVVGNVRAESTAFAVVQAGGIGESKGEIGYEVPVTDCTVNGSVEACAWCPKIEIKNEDGRVISTCISEAYAGGILGRTAASAKATQCHVLDGCICTGAVSAYATEDGKAHEGPWVGYGNFRLRNCPEMPEQEEPETYTFLVLDRTAGGLAENFPPVEGATVTFDGVYSAETGPDGRASFTLRGYRGKSVEVRAEKEGWWSDKRHFIAADGCENTLYIKETEKGKFFVTSCTAVPKGGHFPREIMEQKSTLGYTADREITIRTQVEWCGLTGGALWLYGTQSHSVLRLVPNGSLDTALSGFFLEGEKIELRGKAMNAEGGQVDFCEPTCLEVVPEYTPDVPIELEDCMDFSEVWFLSKLLPDVSVTGVDHLQFTIEHEDGMVTFTLHCSSPDFSQVEIFEERLEKCRDFQIRFEGSLSHPEVVTADSCWKGYMEIRLGPRELEDKGDYDLKTITNTVKKGMIFESPLQFDFEYPFTACKAYVEMRALPAGVLRADVYKLPIKVPSEQQVEIDLGAGIRVVFDVFAGLGWDLGDSAELKGGFYGMADASFLFTQMEGFSPDLTGYIAGKATVKLWDWLEAEKELKLGSFWLDKETGRMKWKNELPEILSWTPADLRYTALPGGFRGSEAGAAAALMDADAGDGLTETVLYENVGEYSDAAMSGDALCFTAADPARPAPDALVLYASSRQADGSWSEPAAVADDGSLDGNPVLSGKYLIWSDTDAALAENSLDAALAASGVSAAVAGEDGYAVTRLTAPGDGYDFGAVVSACGDGAWAAWLRNEGVTAANFLGDHGENTLYTAYYDGAGWTVTRRGSLGTGRLALSGSTLWYRTADGLFSLDLAAEDAEPVCAAEDAVLWSLAGSSAVWLDGEGNLVRGDGSRIACGNGIRELAAASDGSVFLADGTGLRFVSPGSEAPVLLAKGSFRGLRADRRGSEYEVLCYRSEEAPEARTDLCLLRFASVTDLCLTAWETLDEETDGGMAAVAYSIYNNSTAAVESVTVTATEGGKVLMTGEIPAALQPGGTWEGVFRIPAGGSVRELELSVLAGTGEERDPEDNRVTVSVGKADADVTATRLHTDPVGRTWLEVCAVNAGTLTQETLTVRILADGEELEKRTFSGVLPGSARSFALEALPGVEYTVSAETEGDRRPWNDSKVLTWQEPADPVGELTLRYAAGNGGAVDFALYNPSGSIAECTAVFALYTDAGMLADMTGPAALRLAGGETREYSLGADLPEGDYVLKVLFLNAEEEPQPLRQAAVMRLHLT